MEEVWERLRGLRDGKIEIVESEEEEKDVLGKEGDGNHRKSKFGRVYVFMVMRLHRSLRQNAASFRSVAREQLQEEVEEEVKEEGALTETRRTLHAQIKRTRCQCLQNCDSNSGEHDFARGRIRKSVDYFEQARTLAAHASSRKPIRSRRAPNIFSRNRIRERAMLLAQPEAGRVRLWHTCGRARTKVLLPASIYIRGSPTASDSWDTFTTTRTISGRQNTAHPSPIPCAQPTWVTTTPMMRARRGRMSSLHGRNSI